MCIRDRATTGVRPTKSRHRVPAFSYLDSLARCARALRACSVRRLVRALLDVARHEHLAAVAGPRRLAEGGLAISEIAARRKAFAAATGKAVVEAALALIAEPFARPVAAVAAVVTARRGKAACVLVTRAAKRTPAHRLVG